MQNDTGQNKFRDFYFNKSIKEQRLFTVFRDENSWDEKYQILKKYSENQFRSNSWGFFGNVAPAAAAEIFLLPIPKRVPISIEKSLEQTLFCLFEFRETINSFLHLKEKYEEKILENEFISAYKILDKILEKCGYSTWYVDQICFLESVDKSFSPRKKIVLDELKSKKSFVAVQLYNYLNGKYGDDNSLFSLLSEFRSLEEKNLKKFTGAGKLAAFSIIKLLCFPFYELSSREEMLKGLWIAESLSIVDRFLIAEKCVMFVVSNKINVCCEVPERILNKLPPSRLKNIFSYFQNRSSIQDLTHFHRGFKFLIQCLERNTFPGYPVQSSISEHLNNFLLALGVKEIEKESFQALLFKLNGFDFIRAFDEMYFCIKLDSKWDVFRKDGNFVLTQGHVAYSPELVIEFNKILDSDKEDWYESDNVLAKFLKFKKVFTLDRSLESKSKLLSWCYFNNRFFLDYVDVDHFLEDVMQRREESCLKSAIPTLLCTYVESKNLKGVNYSRIYRFLDTFLYLNRVSVPSELIDKKLVSQEELLDLLEFSCITNVIDSLRFIDSSQKLFEERIQLLLFVIKNRHQVDSEFAKLELNELLKEVTLSKEIVEVTHGRLFVDKEQITRLQWDLVDRYTNLYNELHDEEIDRIISGQLNDTHFNFTESDENKVVKKTETSIESEKVPVRFYAFERMYTLIKDSYLFHPYFGLDSCLCVRIRHGHFKTFMRQLFSENNLLAIGGDEEFEFDENYWREQVEERRISEKDYKGILKALNDFSADMGSYIDSIKTNYIHVKTAKFPNSLFDFDLETERLKETFKLIDKKDIEIQEVFKASFDLLEESLARSIEVSKVFLKEDFKIRIVEKLDDLYKKLRMINSDLEILNKITKCKSDTGAHIDSILAWFKMASDERFEDFHLADLVNICKKSSEDYIRGLKLDLLEVNQGQSVKFKGVYKRPLVDIINNVFMNVMIHSGQEYGRCHLSISYKYNDQDLSLRVENKIVTSCDQKQKKLSEVKRKYLAGDLERDMTAEGGTGLIKIISILKNYISDSAIVDFDILDDHFHLDMEIRGAFSK